jgi:hypothetical protein
MEKSPEKLCKRCTKPGEFRESKFPDGRTATRRLCTACEADQRRQRRANGAPKPQTHSETVVAIGDFHAPWQCESALEWALDLIAELQPKTVVQMGDLYDMYSFGRHPRNPNHITPAAEIDTGRGAAEELWRAVKLAAPAATCYQLIGNHDDRPYKLALNKAPELATLIGPELKNLYAFLGVSTVNESNEELVIDGVVYMHGFRSRLGDHAAFNQRNTVCGHSHRGGVHFERQLGGIIWELNAGFLANINAPVFRYRAQARIHKTTRGLGIVDKLGPRFAPFPGETP